MQEITAITTLDQQPQPPTGYVALTETPVYAAFTVLARLIVATFDGAERAGWLDALDNALRSGTTGGQLRRIAALRAEVSGEAAR